MVQLLHPIDILSHKTPSFTNRCSPLTRRRTLLFLDRGTSPHNDLQAMRSFPIDSPNAQIHLVSDACLFSHLVRLGTMSPSTLAAVYGAQT